MSKDVSVFILSLLVVGSLMQQAAAVPRPQQRQQHAIADPDSEVEELEGGAAVGAPEKDDLQGAASLGYGFYSQPYLGGYYGGYGLGGYYPHYYGGYGLATGYPHYGYYGGHHHGYHSHYF